MTNKYIKEIKKLFKAYHKEFDCFGRRKNEKKRQKRS